MKIKTRLLLGFGAMLILMSALAGIGINRLSYLSHAMDEVYQNRYTKVKLAYNIRTNVSTAARSTTNLIINPTQDVAEEQDKANQALVQAAHDFNELGKNAQSPGEKKLISDLTNVGRKYYEYKDQVFKYVANNQVNAAAELRESQGADIQTELLDQLNLLVDYNEQAMKKAYTSSLDRNKDTKMFLTSLMVIGLLIGLGIMLWIIASISNGLDRVVRFLTNFTKGDIGMSSRINVISKDEIGEVAKAFNSMADQIEAKHAQEKEYNRAKEEQAWLKSNVAQMTTALQSAQDLKGAAQTFMSEIAEMIDVTCGSFYLNKSKGAYSRSLDLYGVYAYKPLNSESASFEFGEGLIGQCGLDKKLILLKDIPADYMKVHSSLGNMAPTNLLLYPVLFEGELIAVIELASLLEFGEAHIALLDQLSGSIGITISTINGRNRVEELLRISQALTDELQTQSEELLLQQNELKDSNNRLQNQTIRLLNSEELLQRQQEELQISNEELHKKTELLEAQIRQTEQINRQIQKTKSILEQQTQQLASSSKYKSEFLANMSHELRTPLNSMLILSQLLAENKEGNMLPKQVEFANAIHESGADLIRLINEILDLSKIEAGKIEIVPESVQLIDLNENLKRSFIFLAGKKNLSFTIHIDDEVPTYLYTDSYRVEQILNNLLSNAFKFTEHGGVTLAITMADAQEQRQYGQKPSAKLVAFSVTDTGIGIPKDRLGMIFEAFQQENGTTSRKFGGTGLGLSISKELARLLGGKITVISKPGMGSTFTLYLPEIYPERFDDQSYAQRNLEASAAQEENLSVQETEHLFQITEHTEDKQSALTDLLRGKKILIVDDDIRNIFALSSVFEEYHMQVAFAENGQQALDAVAEADFDLILMDIMMPEMDGYDTIKLLRSNPEFAKLPIIAVTAKATGEDRQQCVEAGATDYISKPIHIEQLLSLMYHTLSDGENADGI